MLPDSVASDARDLADLLVGELARARQLDSKRKPLRAGKRLDVIADDLMHQVLNRTLLKRM